MTTQTVTVPMTSEQLKQLLAETEAAEAAAAAAQHDKYYVKSEFTEVPIATVKPLLKAYKDAKAELDAAKEKLEAAENAIRELMDFAEVLVAEETDQQLVESRVTESQVFDTARFRKEKPALAAEYQKTRRSRSFRVLV